MEIVRLRTLWKGSEDRFLCLWRELIERGHQRFKIEEASDPGSFWIDLFIPELLKYGLPKESIDLTKTSFLWPWSNPLLRPVFKGNQSVMFLDVNYYGIYYDRKRSKFRACTPPAKDTVDLSYNDKLRHTAILRSLGIPFDVFRDNQRIWPIIDFSRLEDKYEYYFRETSEI